MSGPDDFGAPRKADADGPGPQDHQPISRSAPHAFLTTAQIADYVAHLDEMNGGRLGYAARGCWSEPLGETFADCAPSSPGTRDHADAHAKEILRAVHDSLGGMPRRPTTEPVAVMAVVWDAHPAA